jgi:hypothetical protein
VAQFQAGHTKIPGSGRRKGTPNRGTALLRDAILEAATLAGGDGGVVEYLRQQAVQNPKAFLSLLAKVIPTQIDAESDNGQRVVLRFSADDARL